MKKSLVLVVFLLVVACNSSLPEPSFDLLQTDFISSVKNKEGPNYYCRQGALFVQNQIYKHRDSIALQLQALPIIDSTISLEIIKHDSSNYFDIGYYQIKDSVEHQLFYLIAWKKEQGEWCKELEVLYPSKITKETTIETIDLARQRWENLSNQHQPDSLIEQLYTPSAFYLNDGYIYKGRKAIQTKYDYMLKENWHIRLGTIQTFQVTDNLFYDVGQYVSSGKGHYFILWQLQPDGVWRVLLDFNF